jgi:hypothetical protein
VCVGRIDGCKDQIFKATSASVFKRVLVVQCGSNCDRKTFMDNEIAFSGLRNLKCEVVEGLCPVLTQCEIRQPNSVQFGLVFKW